MESTVLSPDVAIQWSPQPASRSQAPRSTASRVCDSCIRRKVKCDQGRPICSRCFEQGRTCTYTSTRRKPGPPRGSHRASPSLRSQRSLGRQPRHHVTPRAPNDEPSLTESSTPIAGDPDELSAPSTVNPIQETSINHQCPKELDISPQQEEYLLEKYFDIIQDVNPIFSKEQFLHNYRNSLCSKDLVSTIVTITAKLTGFADGPDLDARIDFLLSSNLLEIDMIGDFPSLDQFRKACLLAFYEFHQFPGNQSWMRVSRLIRMAYRIGLDRLENLRVLYVDWSTISEKDAQEWRSIWWCMYCLDSYSNLALGTPYLIEDFVNTSLLLDEPSHPPSNIEYDGPREIYLPSAPDNLWKLLPAISSNRETFLRNVHIITVAAMRHTGLATRVHLLRPHEETIPRLANVERHLSALRLALPPGWLNPKRNALLNESRANHHARLITIMHLLMAQLLLSILGCRSQEDSESIMSWQQVLETSQNIASTAEQWDSSFCLNVDPAICFVIFTALVFLELHKKSSTTISAPSNLYSKIESDKTILRLLLKQFASTWTLPRLLTLSFESLSESISGPLSHRQIAVILSRFEAPLHPRWLQFLSSAQTVLDNASQ